MNLSSKSAVRNPEYPPSTPTKAPFKHTFNKDMNTIFLGYLPWVKYDITDDPVLQVSSRNLQCHPSTPMKDPHS